MIERATTLLGSAPEQARDLARQVRSSALADPGLLSRALFVSGSASLGKGEYKAADEELQAAVAQAQAAGDTVLVIKALRNRLKCAFFTRNADEALLHGMEALELARDCGDASLLALTHNDLGLIYGNLSDFEGALEHLLEGLRILRENSPSRLGTLLNNIGNVYLELDDHAEALTFFRSAAEAIRAEGDSWRNEAIALGNVGRASLGIEKYDDALEWIERSLAIYEAKNDPVYLAPTLARYGSALAGAGRAEEAAVTFRRALNLIDSSTHREFADEVLYEFGKFELAQNRAEHAVELLSRGLDEIPAGEVTGRVHDLHLALARAYEAVDDARESLVHYKAYHRVKEAVASSTITVRIRRLMMQFDVERARQQEELFRLRNVHLANANAELQELHRQLEEKNQELHEISIKDALTDLFNRRYLDSQLGVEVSRAHRYQRPLCAAMCDIDHFKEINDRFSHSVGDEVLKRIAILLRESARVTDVISRYGGEEFLLILPDTDLSGAERFTERLRARVADFPWEDIAGGLRVTLSIGVALLDDTMDGPSLLSAADERLYRAKRDGRDRVVA